MHNSGHSPNVPGESVNQPTRQHQSIGPLPRRSFPYPWEDLASLICRVARRMGYEDPHWILSPQRSAHRISPMHLPLLCWREEYQLLQRQLQLDESLLYRLTAHPFAPILYPEQAKTPEIPQRFTRISFPLLSTTAFRQYFLDEPLIKVCPTCLNGPEEHVYDRLYWRLKDVLFCPVHRSPLRQQCPHCGRKIPAIRLDPFRCPSCQSGDYRQPVAGPLAEEHAMYLGTLFFLWALGVHIEEFRLPLEQTHSPLLDLEPKHYISLLMLSLPSLLRGFSHEELLILSVASKVLSLEEVQTYAAYITGTEAIAFAFFHALFLDWPKRFYSTLDLLYHISPPRFVGEREVEAPWFCRSISESEICPWLQHAYQEHTRQFCENQQKTQQIHTSIEELSVQLGVRDRRPFHLRQQDLQKEVQALALSCPQTVPFPWEDLASVLRRASRRMGYAHPSKLLPGERTEPPFREADLLFISIPNELRLFASILHLDEEVIYRLTAHRFASSFREPRRFVTAGENLILDVNSAILFFPDASSTKVCPRCLDEEVEYDRLYWRIQGVFACPQHRVLLVERCPSCKKKMPALRPLAWLCPCCQQGDYRKVVSEPIAEDHLLHAGTCLLLKALGVPLRSDWRLLQPFMPSPLLDLEPPDYFRLLKKVTLEVLPAFSQDYLLHLYTVLHVLSEEDISTFQDLLSMAHAKEIIFFHALFTNWPATFFAFLDRVYRRVTVSPYRRFTFAMEQGRKHFYDAFYDRAFSWLLQAFEEHWCRFLESAWYLSRKAEEDAELAQACKEVWHSWWSEEGDNCT